MAKSPDREQKEDVARSLAEAGIPIRLATKKGTEGSLSDAVYTKIRATRHQLPGKNK